MTNTISGGVFLGEGSYGCTFSPAVLCPMNEDISVIKPKKGKNPNDAQEKKLTKVFWSDRDVEEEWKFAKILREVDPQQRYFIYPREKCNVSKREVLKQANALQCSNLRHVTNLNRKLPVLQMKYGGMTLEKWVQKEKRTISEFLPILKHILLGIQKLHKKGYLHHDLKIDNILIDADGTPHIIDYSLLTPLTGAFDSSVNGVLNNRYWLHPPEYRLQDFYKMSDPNMELPSYVSKHVQAESDLYYFKIQPNDLSTVNQFLLAYFPYCEMYDIIKQYIKTLLTVYHAQGKKGLYNYQTKYASKVDVYSLGLTVMNIVYHLDVPNNNDARYRKLVVGMIHPNPRRRFSVGQCINMIDDILRRPS